MLDNRLLFSRDRDAVLARSPVNDEVIAIQLTTHDSFALAPNAFYNERVTVSGCQWIS